MHHYRIHAQDAAGHWHVLRYTEQTADAALGAIFLRRESGQYSNQLARELSDKWERHYDKQRAIQRMQSWAAYARFCVIFAVGVFIGALA
jgi:hypothetical protein